MDIRELTRAERRVRRAFGIGGDVEFGPGDPADGAGWGPDRTIRAAVLRALLLCGPPDRAEVPALRISGARVTGVLNLRDAVVAYPLWLLGCHFEAAPDLGSAHTKQIRLSRSVLPGLRAPGIRVDGGLHLDGCHVAGPVELDGARVDGALQLEDTVLADPGGVALGMVNGFVGLGVHGARLAAEGEIRITGTLVEGSCNFEHATLSAPGGSALTATVVTVGLDLLCPGLRATGAVRLRGARVDGYVNLRETRLSAPGDNALDAVNIAVGTDLQAIRMTAEGRVDLRGAKIPGQLGLTYARLSNGDGTALRASSVTASELWLREIAPIDGTVNLRRSQFEMLHAEPDTLRGAVRFDGLTYGTLLPRLPARDRLNVLGRDEDGFVPHAYEQLAAAYTRVGDDASARRVRLAGHRRQRATLPRYARIWGCLQDVAVGYGYRPMRAAAWIAVLLAVGTTVFGLHHPPPIDPGTEPVFNPFIYTVNLIVPIIDFGQARAFDPRGPYQWLSFLLTAAGWTLATTVVAGVARVVKRP